MIKPSEITVAASLQQQLDERTVQLQAAQKQLLECKLDFQEFSSSVSHDLQAPLRAVAGFSQYLQEEYGAAFDDTANQYLDQVVGGASRMRQLINGLLEFSRVSSRSEPLENLSLNEVLGDVLAELQPEVNGQSAVIECGDLPDVVGDFQQLTCLFKNLIRNGIIFNKSDKPAIRITAQQIDSDWHVFVQDNGIGIEEKNLDKVFSMFRRLHTREEFDGVGAGLAICRRIVNRHQSQIQLSSEMGGGTKATIIFSSNIGKTVCWEKNSVPREVAVNTQTRFTE